eukprot:SAG31_NODE_7482_length_1677_cov_1.973384_1_plen_303_part_00
MLHALRKGAASRVAVVLFALLLLLLRDHRDCACGVDTAADSTALRRSLAQLKLSQLSQRAADAGIGSAAIADAIDADDPKLALVDLLVASAGEETKPPAALSQQQLLQQDSTARSTDDDAPAAAQSISAPHFDRAVRRPELKTGAPHSPIISNSSGVPVLTSGQPQDLPVPLHTAPCAPNQMRIPPGVCEELSTDPEPTLAEPFRYIEKVPILSRELPPSLKKHLPWLYKYILERHPVRECLAERQFCSHRTLDTAHGSVLRLLKRRSGTHPNSLSARWTRNFMLRAIAFSSPDARRKSGSG